MRIRVKRRRSNGASQPDCRKSVHCGNQGRNARATPSSANAHPATPRQTAGPHPPVAVPARAPAGRSPNRRHARRPRSGRPACVSGLHRALPRFRRIPASRCDSPNRGGRRPLRPLGPASELGPPTLRRPTSQYYTAGRLLISSGTRRGRNWPSLRSPEKAPPSTTILPRSIVSDGQAARSRPSHGL